MLVTDGCAESRFDELMAHEIRWSRTIRAVAGAGFGGTVITHPLPFALLTLLILGLSGPTMILAGAVLAARFILQYQVNAVFGEHKSGRWWLLPLRDMLSFMVFCATFFVGKVTWRGRHFLVDSDGMLSPIEER